MNYAKEIIKIFTEENIEKLKIIIFCIKELMYSNKKMLVSKLNRQRLINIYENCKKVELENKDTENEVKSFIDYYYASMIKDLENKKVK